MRLARSRWPRRLGRGPEIERGLIDDDLTALGRELRHDPADRGHVELADGISPDDVDLGLAGAVDVGNAPEGAAAAPSDLGADDLVPVGLSWLQVR